MKRGSLSVGKLKGNIREEENHISRGSVMLFTKAAGGGNGGNGANKVVGSGKEDGGGGGIVIYSGDDDGGVGECDDEDLRRLESMGAKNKATESEKEPAEAMDATLDTKGRIHSTYVVV